MAGTAESSAPFSSSMQWQSQAVKHRKPYTKSHLVKSNEHRKCSCEATALQHYHCRGCQYKSCILLMVVRHETQRHGITTPGYPIYMCQICSYSVLHLSEYVRHMKPHCTDANVDEEARAFARSELEKCAELGITPHEKGVLKREAKKKQKQQQIDAESNHLEDTTQISEENMGKRKKVNCTRKVALPQKEKVNCTKKVAGPQKEKVKCTKKVAGPQKEKVNCSKKVAGPQKEKVNCTKKVAGPQKEKRCETIAEDVHGKQKNTLSKNTVICEEDSSQGMYRKVNVDAWLQRYQHPADENTEAQEGGSTASVSSQEMQFNPQSIALVKKLNEKRKNPDGQNRQKASEEKGEELSEAGQEEEEWSCARVDVISSWKPNLRPSFVILHDPRMVRNSKRSQAEEADVEIIEQEEEWEESGEEEAGLADKGEEHGEKKADHVEKEEGPSRKGEESVDKGVESKWEEPNTVSDDDDDDDIVMTAYVAAPEKRRSPRKTIWATENGVNKKVYPITISDPEDEIPIHIPASPDLRSSQPVTNQETPFAQPPGNSPRREIIDIKELENSRAETTVLPGQPVDSPELVELSSEPEIETVITRITNSPPIRTANTTTSPSRPIKRKSTTEQPIPEASPSATTSSQQPTPMHDGSTAIAFSSLTSKIKASMQNSSEKSPTSKPFSVSLETLNIHMRIDKKQMEVHIGVQQWDHNNLIAMEIPNPPNLIFSKPKGRPPKRKWKRGGPRTKMGKTEEEEEKVVPVRKKELQVTLSRLPVLDKLLLDYRKEDVVAGQRMNIFEMFSVSQPRVPSAGQTEDDGRPVLTLRTEKSYGPVKLAAMFPELLAEAKLAEEEAAKVAKEKAEAEAREKVTLINEDADVTVLRTEFNVLPSVDTMVLDLRDSTQVTFEVTGEKQNYTLDLNDIQEPGGDMDISLSSHSTRKGPGAELDLERLTPPCSIQLTSEPCSNVDVGLTVQTVSSSTADILSESEISPPNKKRKTSSMSPKSRSSASKAKEKTPPMKKVNNADIKRRISQFIESKKHVEEVKDSGENDDVEGTRTVDDMLGIEVMHRPVRKHAAVDLVLQSPVKGARQEAADSTQQQVGKGGGAIVGGASGGGAKVGGAKVGRASGGGAKASSLVRSPQQGVDLLLAAAESSQAAADTTTGGGDGTATQRKNTTLVSNSEQRTVTSVTNKSTTSGAMSAGPTLATKSGGVFLPRPVVAPDESPGPHPMVTSSVPPNAPASGLDLSLRPPRSTPPTTQSTPTSTKSVASPATIHHPAGLIVTPSRPTPPPRPASASTTPSSQSGTIKAKALYDQFNLKPKKSMQQQLPQGTKSMPNSPIPDFDMLNPQEQGKFAHKYPQISQGVPISGIRPLHGVAGFVSPTTSSTTSFATMKELLTAPRAKPGVTGLSLPTRVSPQVAEERAALNREVSAIVQRNQGLHSPPHQQQTTPRPPVPPKLQQQSQRPPPPLPAKETASPQHKPQALSESTSLPPPSSSSGGPFIHGKKSSTKAGDGIQLQVRPYMSHSPDSCTVPLKKRQVVGSELASTSSSSSSTSTSTSGGSSGGIVGKRVLGGISVLAPDPTAADQHKQEVLKKLRENMQKPGKKAGRSKAKSKKEAGYSEHSLAWSSEGGTEVIDIKPFELNANLGPVVFPKPIAIEPEIESVTSTTSNEPNRRTYPPVPPPSATVTKVTRTFADTTSGASALDSYKSADLFSELHKRGTLSECDCGLNFQMKQEEHRSLYYLHRSCHNSDKPLLCGFCDFKASNWFTFYGHHLDHTK